MLNGIIAIDKPTAMSSFGIVARIRRVLSEEAGKKVKVGHTGTLDPFASGLMLLVTGTECKQAGKYSKLDKIYEATITLGTTSSTGDPEGELQVVSTEQPTRQQVEAVLGQFIGEITQTPPNFSAIKVNGVRAYKLAREGKPVEIPTRQVKVYELELLEYAYPTLRVRASVSSGTYIRTLAEDIGKTLGTGAYCTELRRTRVGEWDIAQAQTLADFGITT